MHGIPTGGIMNKMLFGFALGAIAGVVALKKMGKNDMTEKAVECAQQKLKN